MRVRIGKPGDPDRRVNLRPATAEDVPAIKQLLLTLYENPTRIDQLAEDMAEGHAVLGTLAGEVVAFRLQRKHISDEVLSGGFMFVRRDLRRAGLGEKLVRYFEKTADPKWRISMLITSDTHATKDRKDNSVPFWEACGYELVTETDRTRVLVKTLGAAERRHGREPTTLAFPTPNIAG